MASTTGTTMFKVTELHESKSNPRKIGNKQADAELAASVKEHGVLTPLLLRKRDAGGFEVVFGSRRAAAARAAGLPEVPGTLREDLDEATVRELQLVENGQRENVHPLDEADGYKALVDEYRYDAERIASKVSKPVAHVRRRLKLVDLGEAGRKAWLDGKLTEEAAFVLARVPAALQAKACTDAIEENEPDRWEAQNGRVFEAVTGAEMRHIVRRALTLPIAKAPFPTDDTTLVPAAGACTTCVKRTSTQAELFADFEKEDLCTDTACHRKKADAQFARVKEAEVKRGVLGRAAKPGERVPPPAKILTPSESKKIFSPHDPTRVTYDAPYAEITEAQRAKLEAKGAPVVLTQRPDGAAVLLARKQDAAKLQPTARAGSEAHGVSAAEKARRSKEREKETRRKERERSGFEAVVSAMVAAGEKRFDEDDVLRAIVIGQIRDFDAPDAEDMIARRALSDVDAATGKKVDAVEVLVRAVTVAKRSTLRGLFVELFVTNEASWTWQQLAEGKVPYSPGAGLLAKALGVNVAAAWKAGEKAAERELDAAAARKAMKDAAPAGAATGAKKSGTKPAKKSAAKPAKKPAAKKSAGKRR